jgi:hypothetical protein
MTAEVDLRCGEGPKLDCFDLFLKKESLNAFNE